MRVEEIVNNEQDLNKVIEKLQSRAGAPPAPDIDAIIKEMDIDQHDIMDPYLRPDKAVRDDKGTILRYETINRIPLALQELIVDKAVEFALGNPVIRTYQGDDANVKRIETYVERVLRDNMSKTMDREMARILFTYTEVAEYWYPKKTTKNKKYGFDSEYKLKCALFTPEKGITHYPLFDELGDFIAYSRGYFTTENGVQTEMFQTFTDEHIVVWKKSVNTFGWEVVSNNNLPKGLTKMPIVYGWQKHPEYRNAKKLISRLEVLLSNNAEVNDYHSAPKILVSGDVTGWGQKGQNNMILQSKGGAKVEYLSWDSAPESVKNEINNLLMLIYQLTQTPNITFDNIKGLGTISGVSIKLLFMDAHLKVMKKEGILLDYFSHRYNVINAYLAVLDDPTFRIVDDVEIDPALDPFMVADDKEQAEITMTLNGNQPVKSQETTVREYGGDSKELQRIRNEEAERNRSVLGAPTITGVEQV